MIFEWTITFIGEETQVWEKQTPKLDFVLEENSDRQYKSSVAIDLFGEKTALIKGFKLWDTIKASLNFRAREYNWRWYNSIWAWKIEWSNGETTQKSSPKQDEDLPF
jgi:hypothetical protein